MPAGKGIALGCGLYHRLDIFLFLWQIVLMVEKKCLICGKIFYIKEFHAKKGWGKYCSIKCHANGQIKGKWVECNYCGKKIWRTPPVILKGQKTRIFIVQLIVIVLGKTRMSGMV